MPRVVKKTQNKDNFSVRLDPDLRKEIETIASTLDVKASLVLRWAARHYVAEYKAGRVGILPFADGSHDDSPKSR